jgi:REP element-mobilizing transposase RayT
MLLNEAGRMILAEWEALPQRFPTVEIDAFVVMPNHIHGIIVIVAADNVVAGVGAGVAADVGAGLVPALVPGATTHGATTHGATTHGATTRVAPTVGDIVGAFKSITTVSYTRGVKQSGWPPFPGRLWQRNYYEHIIRNDESLNRIRQYIADNPARWALDRENANAVSYKPEDAWRA